MARKAQAPAQPAGQKPVDPAPRAQDQGADASRIEEPAQPVVETPPAPAEPELHPRAIELMAALLAPVIPPLAMLVAGIWMAWGFGLPTGGADLMGPVR